MVPFAGSGPRQGDLGPGPMIQLPNPTAGTNGQEHLRRGDRGTPLEEEGVVAEGKGGGGGRHRQLGGGRVWQKPRDGDISSPTLPPDGSATRTSDGLFTAATHSLSLSLTHTHTTFCLYRSMVFYVLPGKPGRMKASHPRRDDATTKPFPRGPGPAGGRAEAGWLETGQSSSRVQEVCDSSLAPGRGAGGGDWLEATTVHMPLVSHPTGEDADGTQRRGRKGE
ncbi:hypothetical protein VTK73DRAFT_4324 [Phialemonium thermophilum]|uniref:Uncharacterized protein n=1 Tax=Phialemonium thermophilum TaxID=223376 RepID=A0ABR3V9R6_9PEZI